MRQGWLWGVCALALAACGETQPPEVNHAAQCADAADAATRTAACTAVIEDPEADAEAKASAFANRADVRFEAGDVTPALRDFEAALGLQADNEAALLGRARILINSGQLDAAEPLLRRAVEAHNSGEAHEMLGQVDVRRGAFESAIENFNAALAQDQRSAIALAGRARAKQRLGELDGAAGDYDAAIRQDGDLVEARAGRCWLDLNQGRELGRALRDAEAAVAVEPAHVEAQVCRGVLQLREGQWEAAKASFDAALAIESGNPMALFGRGVARRRSGDGEGREDMNLARDFDGHIGEQFDDLGVRTY
jgi:tetratricopeptide (TPR) repeat protein